MMYPCTIVNDNSMIYPFTIVDDHSNSNDNSSETNDSDDHNTIWNILENDKGNPDHDSSNMNMCMYIHI